MILLGSNSPRRRELITGLNRGFRVIALPDVDESYSDELSPLEVPVYIAEKKAAAYRDFIQSADDILITADTIVCVEGEILGKPTDRDDAFRMLRRLSGRTHYVVTGVTLTRGGQMVSFAEKTDVTFIELTDDQINYYIDNYHPYDKAGAYGIQEWIGYVAMARIEGSFYNVMGLPICRLNQELRRLCGEK